MRLDLCPFMFLTYKRDLEGSSLFFKVGGVFEGAFFPCFFNCGKN